MKDVFVIEKLDHGVLSIPNRTRNINSDLDKFKAEYGKIKKKEIEDRKFLNNQSQSSAKELFATLGKNHFQYYAKHAGIKVSEARLDLKAMCINPSKAIKVFNAIIDMESKQ